MKKQTSKQSGSHSSNNNKALKVGAGIAAGIAGALVAGYLAYEKTKPQHAKIKAWVASARHDAAKQIAKVKSMSAEEYGRIIAKAVEHYGNIQKASAPEIKKAITDAKAEWKHIKTQAQ